MIRTEYSAESSMRRPQAFVRAALCDLIGSRTWELAWQLARRNIAASYRRSLLGYLWGILPIAFIALVFTAAAENRIIALGNTRIPYTAYVVIGLALWQTFVESLSGPLTAMYDAKSMLARINLPKEAFVLSKIGEVLFNFGAKLVLIAAVLVWYRIVPDWTVLFAPLSILAIVALGTALGVLLTPIGLLYDDVRRTLPIMVQMGLLVTPVIFALPTQGYFATVVHENPLTPLIMTAREWLTGEPITMLVAFIVISLGSVLMLLFSLLGLRLVSPFAIERLGG